MNKTRLVLCATLLATLSGCVNHTHHVDRPDAGNVYVAPPPVEAVVFAEEDYIYYPNYQVYYSRSRHQYVCLEGNAWVARPAPQGVRVNVLLASPSVRMDFHDSPANHHASVIKQYPKNWVPPPANQGQNQKDGQHEGNSGR